MTFITCARRLALQESWALRGWAKAGMRPPTVRPVNHWAEWSRIDKHSNETTHRKRTAA